MLQNSKKENLQMLQNVTKYNQMLQHVTRHYKIRQNISKCDKTLQRRTFKVDQVLQNVVKRNYSESLLISFFVSFMDAPWLFQLFLRFI